MYSFTYYNPCRTVIGQNALEQLATMKLPGTKAIIICTPERFYVERTQRLLKQNGVDSVVFDEVRSNPSSAGIDKAAALAKASGCDFVIGLGGGSSTDSAKGVAIALKNEGPIWSYVAYCEGAKAFDEAAPIVAVSTTSGTGTEADPFGVLANDELGMKLDLWHECLFPTISIVDPCLQVTVPKLLTASQGMDVIFHAAEVFLNMYHNPYSDMLAIKSLEFARDNLVEAYRHGDNVEAREGMAIASNLAGMGLAQCATISMHAMSHTLGALHNSIPHGVALAIIAHAWYRYYAEVQPERMALLSKLLDLGDSPDSFADFIDESLRAVELWNVDYTKYGIDPARAEEYAKHCLTVTADYLIYEDYPMTLENCARLFKESLAR